MVQKADSREKFFARIFFLKKKNNHDIEFLQELIFGKVL